MDTTNYKPRCGEFSQECKATRLLDRPGISFNFRVVYIETTKSNCSCCKLRVKLQETSESLYCDTVTTQTHYESNEKSHAKQF